MILQKILSSLILFFALTFPCCLTLNYFVIFADASPAIQKTAYSLGKIFQFSLPILWVGLVCRERFWICPINRQGIVEGTLFGIAVLIAMLGAYFLWLRLPGSLFAPDSPACQAIHNKMSGFGLTNKEMFILLGLFYAVIHSGLEEYYWRWFVFRKLSCSAVISSLGFTAHHVIIVGTYFGYRSLYSWLALFGVFIGGWYWCWLYQRTNSIWGPWIGHGIVDTALFTLGFLIVIKVSL